MTDDLEKLANAKTIKALQAIITSAPCAKHGLQEIGHLFDRDTEVVTCQRNASWLVKRHLEHGKPLSDEVRDRARLCLVTTQDADTKLHLLQCFEHLIVKTDSDVMWFDFLVKESKSGHKFIQAWAYHGLYILGQCFESRQTDILVILQQALISGAPSVKARIRNLLKQGYK